MWRGRDLRSEAESWRYCVGHTSPAPEYLILIDGEREVRGSSEEICHGRPLDNGAEDSSDLELESEIISVEPRQTGSM